jgi:hypothetical protein
MLDSLKAFAFRRRRWIAAAWIAALVVVCGGPWAYLHWVPDDVDTGIAVAARAWFYRRTFREVERARAEFAEGRGANARARLERFLAARSDVQPAQLWSHAVSDAGTLYADVCIGEGRPGRAAAALGALTERLPLDYQPWWARGRALAADGDDVSAASALREAFKLTLHHSGVIEDYLASLDALGESAQIAWVADEHERALARSAPRLLLKAGIPRTALERRVLAAVGIPVEHGRFFRHLDRFDGERGAGRRAVFPPEMFEPWPWDEELVVQLRMENGWDGFTVDRMVLLRRDGRREVTTPRVGYLHRPGSGVGAYAEIFTGVSGRDVRQVALTYSSAEPRLSEAAQRTIEKARRNLESLAAKEGG